MRRRPSRARPPRCLRAVLRVLLPVLLLVLVTAGGGPSSAAQRTGGDDGSGTIGGEPHLEVALSPSRLTVGDRVVAVLTLAVPTGTPAAPPRFPAWSATWGDAEILEAGEPRRLEGGPAGSAGPATYRQRLVLTAFRPGDVTLPPRSVAVPLETGTVEVATPEGLGFTIEAVLPPEEAPEGTSDGGAPTGGRDGGAGRGFPTDLATDPAAPGEGGDEREQRLTLRPETAPRELPLSAGFWWTLALAAAACLGLGLVLWRTVRVPEPSRPALAPLAELEASLERVPRSASTLEGHDRLSRALRRYLGRQLGFPAPESTTSEIRRRLAARHLPEGFAHRTGRILEACDLVRFARRPSSPGLLEERTATARELGRQLEEHLHPQREADPGHGASGPLRGVA